MKESDITRALLDSITEEDVQVLIDRVKTKSFDSLIENMSRSFIHRSKIEIMKKVEDKTDLEQEFGKDALKGMFDQVFEPIGIEQLRNKTKEILKDVINDYVTQRLENYLIRSVLNDMTFKDIKKWMKTDPEIKALNDKRIATVKATLKSELSKTKNIESDIKMLLK